MENNKHKDTPVKLFLRALTEVVFIIFLFYANLLMGEFTKNGRATGKSMMWAIDDIFTVNNFVIAVIAAIAGHYVFQFLRKKL